MKGIYYDRHADYDSRVQRDEWAANNKAQTIVSRSLLKILPDTKVEGEIKWRCNGASEERCENCTNCMNIEVSQNENGDTRYSYTDEPLTYDQVSKFHWTWSGCGVIEHWFDNEAICLKKTGDYISGSGLTADATRVVAYTHHVEVRSFRGDCRDETEKIFRPNVIWAEFKNFPQDYRANWTGFAFAGIAENGRYTSSGGWVNNFTPIIGDKLDDIIEMSVSHYSFIENYSPTICRHNGNVQARIVVGDPKRLPLYLCKSCRMRGVQWQEFISRNRADACPYFRRACKSVVEKSDKLPDWFKWSGNNLLAANRRMADSDCEAYEVSYVRRRDGFIRRSVLLLNNVTREAWMHRYNGYIPQTLAEFNKKYIDGRQIERAEEEVEDDT